MKRCILYVLAVVFFIRPAAASTEVWMLMTTEGKNVTQICYEPSVGDEYVSGDNVLYEVVRVEGDTAYISEKGDFLLPDVSWLEADGALPVMALGGERKLAIYCTHSDESYEPSDGLYSDPQRGSIYEVAEALAAALREDGAEVTVSRQTHHPHDAGAYRRSRQTAVQLIKDGPDAVFDLHRDGIPDPASYAVTIGGEKVSRVRLLVGRSNQNMEVNKQFAAQIKAVADKVYPGLIKDIYMGRGVYNQDLSPRSLLFECGTYTLEKERVLASMPLLADVVTRSLYGGVVGSAGRSDASGVPSETGGVTQGAPEPSVPEEKGAGSGILWLIVLAVAGLGVFAFVSTGSVSGAKHKIGRNMSEMTGGLLGKKPKEK